MRVIADSSGVDWTVFEVKRQDTASDRWLHLPDEFANGWLCFESDFSKRRLTPVPPRWEGYSDAELARLLAAAHPVGRLRLDAHDERAAP
ncbi:MAG TPA: hypothetical protein VHW01_00405 [Polyangiaceae bacterium]|nr:hypothetical protein [Polyangiaceae bacterium]